MKAINVFHSSVCVLPTHLTENKNPSILKKNAFVWQSVSNRIHDGVKRALRTANRVLFARGSW